MFGLGLKANGVQLILVACTVVEVGKVTSKHRDERRRPICLGYSESPSVPHRRNLIRPRCYPVLSLGTVHPRGTGYVTTRTETLSDTDTILRRETED